MITTISVIHANMLHSLRSIKVFPYSPLKAWREELHRWHVDLPKIMQLHRLLDTKEINDNQRRIIFYMHLFYLSAILFKGRVVVGYIETSRSNATDNYGKSLMHDTFEAKQAVLDGLQAARTIAKLLQILHSRDSVFKKCWLCIFSAYSAFMYLTLSVSKTLLLGPSADRTISHEDVSSARRCLDLLHYCSSSDEVARHFAHTSDTIWKTLEIYLHRQQAHSASESRPHQVNQPLIPTFDGDSFTQPSTATKIPTTQTTTATTATPSGKDGAILSPLLQPPTTESSPLHTLSIEILDILCHPFDSFAQHSPSSVAAGPTMPGILATIEEIGIGAHLNWACHVASPYNGVELSMIQEGSVMGSKVPSGWTC